MGGTGSQMGSWDAVVSARYGPVNIDFFAFYLPWFLWSVACCLVIGLDPPWDRALVLGILVPSGLVCMCSLVVCDVVCARKLDKVFADVQAAGKESVPTTRP